MNLFLDLDGTLLDSRERLYKLFSFLVPQSKLNFTEYWEYKRDGIGHNEILQNLFDYSGDSTDRFQQRWRSLIEQPEWIQYDKPFPGVTEKLIELNKKYSLILITARQSVDVVNEQLDKFNWEGLFDYVLVTGQEREKKDLILDKVSITPDDWLIGDTGIDIQTGKILKIKTAAVLSGFRNNRKLQKYDPDIIIDCLLDFYK